MKRARNRRKKTPQGPPMLVKLSFGSIIGWWDCQRCGLSLPGQLDPSKHGCPREKGLR